MELLYFIGGVLSVGVIYGVWLLRSVKSSHTELLARHQSQSSISSIRNNEFEEQLGDLKILIGDIQASMEKDQYENLSGINQRIKELDTVAYENLSKIEFASGANEKNFSTVFSEIQQVKNALKIIAQDPNMTSNY